MDYTNQDSLLNQATQIGPPVQQQNLLPGAGLGLESGRLQSIGREKAMEAFDVGLEQSRANLLKSQMANTVYGQTMPDLVREQTGKTEQALGMGDKEHALASQAQTTAKNMITSRRYDEFALAGTYSQGLKAAAAAVQNARTPQEKAMAMQQGQTLLDHYNRTHNDAFPDKPHAEGAHDALTQFDPRGTTVLFDQAAQMAAWVERNQQEKGALASQEQRARQKGIETEVQGKKEISTAEIASSEKIHAERNRIELEMNEARLRNEREVERMKLEGSLPYHAHLGMRAQAKAIDAGDGTFNADGSFSPGPKGWDRLSQDEKGALVNLQDLIKNTVYQQSAQAAAKANIPGAMISNISGGPPAPMPQQNRPNLGTGALPEQIPQGAAPAPAPAQGAGSQRNPVQVNDQKGYNALKSGQWYRWKDGSIHQKP